MKIEQTIALEPKVQAAVDELQALIRQQHPDVEFRVTRDPEAVHLIAVLDVDDTDLAADDFLDRMMQLQIDDELPLFVIPIRAPEREQAVREAALAQRRTVLPSTSM
jgi:hypothetical protein